MVNIPATLFATGYYEFLMRDSLQRIGKGAARYEKSDDELTLHLTKSGIVTSRGNPIGKLDTRNGTA